MVKAKIGFEDLYEAVVVKQAALEAEKKKAIAEVEATFADRDVEIAKLFSLVADVVEDAPVEDVVEEVPSDTADGSVTFAG